MLKTLISIKLQGAINVMLSGGTKNATKASPMKKIGFACVYLFILAIFVALSALYAVILVPLADFGLSWVYFSLFMLVSFSVVFFLSILETKTELFESKDNELLLSMPILPRDIINMRVSVVLIYNYVEMAIVMAPAIIVYGMYTGDAMGIIGGTLCSLLLPLLATSLASGVGAIVAAISRKMKNKTLGAVVISLLFIALYMFGYGYLMEGMESFVEDLEANSGVLAATFTPIMFLGKAALLSAFELIALAAVCIGVSLLCYYLISKNYIKIVTDRKAQDKKEYKKTASKKSSALVSLTKKELGRFFSSATYILNSSMGLIFMVVISVLALFGAEDINMLISALFEDPGMSIDVYKLLSPLFISVIIFFASLSMISCSALSLEGKNLWILKSMPLKSHEVLLAKTLPHIIITAIPTLIASIIFAIIAKAGPLELVFYILTPQAANVFNAFFGMFINTAFPKLEYENEAQPIKQSLACFLAMMGQMLVAMILLSVSTAISFMGLPTVALIAQLLVLVALAAVSAVLLLIPLARRYERL